VALPGDFPAEPRHRISVSGRQQPLWPLADGNGLPMIGGQTVDRRQDIPQADNARRMKRGKSPEAESGQDQGGLADPHRNGRNGAPAPSPGRESGC
jgi:hypothetical protein